MIGRSIMRSSAHIWSMRVQSLREQARITRNYGTWSSVPQNPADPIHGINEQYKACSNPNKVNLTVGAYRDESGKPWVLPAVRAATKRVTESPDFNMEYLPINGDKEFLRLALQVAYGKKNHLLADQRIAATQTMSGSGSYYLGVMFLKNFWKDSEMRLYIPDQTWPIHNSMLSLHGIKREVLPYYNRTTKGLDFERLCNTLEAAPERSIVLLHSCAHNPTGVDPTASQWRELAHLFKRKRHFAFFDMAYQGFASGDLEADNLSIKIWTQLGLDFCLAQSFAKNMGLYGHRLGTLSMVCEDPKQASCVQSQFDLIARNTWSSASRFGSDVAKQVLSDPQLYQMWLQDMKVMSARIKHMRSALVKELTKQGSEHSWSHITDQIGMFAFTGLSAPQCKQLIEKHAVFLTMNGRISVAGLNQTNVQYVASAFADVCKDSALSASLATHEESLPSSKSSLEPNKNSKRTFKLNVA